METESILAELNTLIPKRVAISEERASLLAKTQTIKTWQRNKDRPVSLGLLASYKNQLDLFNRRLKELESESTIICGRIAFLNTQIHANDRLVKCPMCGHNLQPETKGSDILKCDSGHSYKLCLIEQPSRGG